MKKYEFKPYNPSFPDLFEEEKNRLSQVLSGDYQTEHIGSTAVPGLGGKGIIDIMIATSRDKMEALSQQAQKAEYIFRPLASTETRLFLRTEYPEDFSKKQSYHLHITFPESDDWKEAIAFRDYLKDHPEDLNKYEEIKKKAAQESNEDTDKYKNIKEDILQEITQKALKKSGSTSPQLKNSNNFDLYIIIHGCPQNEADLIPSNKHWTGWLEQKLRDKGLNAFAPDMPIPWEPDYERWKEVLENYKITENSLLIGHSCGGAFLVRYLLSTDKKVKKLILVAPAKTSIKEDRKKNFYDFDLSNASGIANEIVIFISNDHESMLKSFELYKEALKPKVIKLEGKKHFVPFQMGTNEFPELLEEVLK